VFHRLRSGKKHFALADPALSTRVGSLPRQVGAGPKIILEWPEGSEPIVRVERGSSLAGGPRQRIANRALIAAPAQPHLDEATSALDYDEVKTRIVQPEPGALARRTVLVIAHRLSARGAWPIASHHRGAGRLVEDGAKPMTI